ncbi:MAG: sensor histidine kinase [Bariatricus sp.]|nr:sensor histidine kinase [Bariatricus sp.]
MTDNKKMSLNKRLFVIAIAAFVPMLLGLIYALVSLNNATTAYEKITHSVTYANQCMEFKKRMDYSMYLAVIGKKEYEELGKEMTVNGTVTVNPLEYVQQMKEKCSELSRLATVESNRSQMRRMRNMLESLEGNVLELETMIEGEGLYDENMEYLDQNIYMVTSIIEDGFSEYISVETTNLNEIKKEQEEKNNNVYRICIWGAILAIVSSVYFSIKALKSVTVPIRKLCNLTQKVAEGDFTVKSKVDDVDEIAVLTRSFNEMTEEIGGLVDDIKEKEKNLYMMETKLLQEQINPHFLYNTLDTIVWLAEDNQKKEVVSMVTSLSSFFRSTLSGGKDFITVKEEQNHIESYLKIQQVRYQDIMEYRIEMEQDILDIVIPKLLLQPLVENALYHGVKNKRGKSMILVKGRKQDENLIFKVIDNGKGMTKEQLKRLRENLKKAPDERATDSFGLANVNQRIQHYYGKNYGIFIQSEYGIQTEVTVIMKTSIE